MKRGRVEQEPGGLASPAVSPPKHGNVVIITGRSAKRKIPEGGKAAKNDPQLHHSQMPHDPSMQEHTSARKHSQTKRGRNRHQHRKHATAQPHGDLVTFTLPRAAGALVEAAGAGRARGRRPSALRAGARART
jgi:hypothetical protein